MKFSNFLFPESRTPDNDFAIINDALREAELCDQLDYDALWLAEHHFDGGCAYVDPVTFASAIAARTQRITIGFAVAQMAPCTTPPGSPSRSPWWTTSAGAG
jgi:alkanesulfonate monooxygenase SsuD/methylene tetrahydromethanopterin reductase-like flavin-dependent oxidoreductase (luciferase family)